MQGCEGRSLASLRRGCLGPSLDRRTPIPRDAVPWQGLQIRRQPSRGIHSGATDSSFAWPRIRVKSERRGGPCVTSDFVNASALPTGAAA